jgi:hypothetical protein
MDDAGEGAPGKAQKWPRPSLFHDMGSLTSPSVLRSSSSRHALKNSIHQASLPVALQVVSVHSVPVVGLAGC